MSTPSPRSERPRAGEQQDRDDDARTTVAGCARAGARPGASRASRRGSRARRARQQRAAVDVDPGRRAVDDGDDEAARATATLSGAAISRFSAGTLAKPAPRPKMPPRKPIPRTRRTSTVWCVRQSIALRSAGSRYRPRGAGSRRARRPRVPGRRVARAPDQDRDRDHRGAERDLHHVRGQRKADQRAGKGRDRAREGERHRQAQARHPFRSRAGRRRACRRARRPGRAAHEIEVEREEAADDRHEKHAAADARHHGDHADREARDEERGQPDPPWFGHFWRYANPMPRFAANVSMLFAEHGFLERFAAARRPASARSSTSTRTTSMPRRSPARRAMRPWKSCCTTCRRATRNAASVARLPAGPRAALPRRPRAGDRVRARGALREPPPDGRRGPRGRRARACCATYVEQPAAAAKRLEREGMRL